MSKENFATRVINRLAEEYDVAPATLAHHRGTLEEAADTEALITDEELDLLMSGTDASRAVNEKYPLIDAVSLCVVDELERKDLDSEDEDEEDFDEEDDEEEDDDEDEEEDDDDD